jgi:hypothetical protein
MMITQEMTTSFENRMNGHINLVKKYAQKIVEIFPEFSELNTIVESHDSTKFLPENKPAYIHFNWMLRCRNTENEYKLSPEIDKELSSIRAKHGLEEKHHPSYWGDVTTMPIIYICEMCADWCAVNEELKTSPFDFADKVLGKSLKFSEFQITFIRKLLQNIWGN